MTTRHELREIWTDPRRLRVSIVTLLTLLLLFGGSLVAADSLDDLLQTEGLLRQDLGWTPQGWWSRYPADIPHKMRHFDDLLAQPLAVVTFTRTAGAATRSLLNPEALAVAPKGADGPLYKATHRLGIERRFGGFRSYSANLTSPPQDLVEALLALHESEGRATRFHTFGQDSPYPNPEAELEKLASGLSPDQRLALGRLVANLVDAQSWVDKAFRNVTSEDRLAVQSRWDLGAEMTDALEYFPALDDAAARWDEASLWYGGLKAVAALELARHELSGTRCDGPVEFDWNTPLGWIRIRGEGKDEIDADDSFLVVDLGGNDVHRGAAGATRRGHGFSVLLDLGGNDLYEGGTGPSQGSGLAGVGILLDAGGRDRYRSDSCSQGFGQLGLGVLMDLSGDDSYQARFSGQGSAFLGVGVLLEVQGDDKYRIESDGQGFGGAGGVGTLADGSGDDVYEAVRDPSVTGRPSYHSEGKVAVSNAQGVGMGRRGDGSDGHSWGGGLGQLLDAAGDDRYIAGNWSMGTGYWFGTGLLWDGGGDDSYDGVIWSQASGAHFCIGALIDESGDDRHRVDPGGRSSLAFGHDFAVVLHLDGAGNDLYENHGDGLAFSINRSFAFLMDLGGDDTYRSDRNHTPGTARYDKRFADRSGDHTYFADSSSLGLFLDVGGDDRYEGPDLENGSLRREPPEAPNRRVRNWSLAADVAQGSVSLAPRPEKPPSGTQSGELQR